MTESLLIALDIDGTVLFEDGHTLSPNVVEAVHEAEAAGHLVTLATGRSWSATHPILERLDITPEYVVSSNGAAIYKRSGDDYVAFHTEVFDPKPVLGQLIAQLPDASYMVELADGSQLYTHFPDSYSSTTPRKVAFDELSAQPVTRVVAVSPEHGEQEFATIVERAGLSQVTYAIGYTSWLDIAPEGVDKGTALKLICGWLGHDEANTMVVGDGRNDLGMFDWAQRSGGTAVAMGQAVDEVRERATIVTHSVDRGGVAHILATIA